MANKTNKDILKKIYKETKGGNNTVLPNGSYNHVLNAFFESDYRNAFINHQLEPYNKLITEGLSKIISNSNPITFLVENQKSAVSTINKKVKYFEVEIEISHPQNIKPCISVGIARNKRTLYPNECRITNSIYQSDIHANIKMTVKFLDENKVQIGNEPTVISKNDIKIGAIPVMLHSALCSLYQMPERDLRKIAKEDPLDLGGYFLINGSEKVLVSQEKKISNHVTFYTNPKKQFPYACEIKCTKDDTFGAPSTATVAVDKKGKLLFSLNPGFAPKVRIPIFIMFKALGIINDGTIIEYITYDIKDSTLNNLLQPSIQDKIVKKPAKGDEESSNVIIQTQQDALEYIADEIRAKKASIFITRGITGTDTAKKISYVTSVLTKHLFPHLSADSADLRAKAYFLGYMCNKLILGISGVIPEDDRDNYALKRVDTAGILVSQLFYQTYSIFQGKLKENIRRELMGKSFKVSDFENMLYRVIPETEIESKMKKPFATGEWTVSRTAGMSGAKQGVSQLLQRLTPVNTVSALRRIATPQNANQKAKPEIRRLNVTHWGILCVSGNTRVLLENGDNIKISDLEKNWKSVKIQTMNVNNCATEISGIKKYYKISTQEYGKKIYKMTLANGYVLKATEDHPILTDDGYKTCGDLQIDDIVVIRTDCISDEYYKLPDHYQKNVSLEDFAFHCSIEKDYCFMEIIDKTEIQLEWVYDITTESENHNFVGNGLIISNCPTETPEGQSIGMVKNLAMLAKISTSSTSTTVLKILSEMDDIISLYKLNPNTIKKYTKVFVNGDWIFCANDADNIVKKLRQYRRELIVNPNISIVQDFETNEIRIYTDAGRCMRPLYIVDEGNKLRMNVDIINKLKKGELQWDDLIEQQYIEYIETQEAMYNTLVAMYPEDLANPQNKLKQYSHCEIHPCVILGTAASLIPFSNHNQSPRNMFQCAQGKQALSVYAMNFRERFDTMGHVLYYPEMPLVSTNMAHFSKYNEAPAGQNVIVAIMTYTGYNVEDSLIVSESAIQRGLFRSTYYKMYKEELKSNEDFRKPNPEETSKFQSHLNYSKLGDDGFPPINTHLKKDDIIIGKVRKLDNREQYGNYTHKDQSIAMKDREGYLDGIIIDKNQDGNRFVKLRIRMNRILSIGDKCACYDDQTYVMTNSGWKLFKDLKETDKVATMINRDSIVDNKRVGCKELVYKNPVNLYKYNYDSEIDGKMYKIKSQQVDLVVTPNHNMFVAAKGSKGNDKIYRLIRADTMEGTMKCYKKNIEIHNPSNSLNTFELPAYKSIRLDLPILSLNIDDWLIFFGIWIAEGCCDKTRVCIAANKPRVKKNLEDVCKNMGFKICKNIDKRTDILDDDDDTEKYRHSWRIYDKRLISYLVPLSVGAINKYLPNWCWRLDKEQAQLLIYGMMLGDGHIVRNNNETADDDNTNYDITPNSTWRYDTSSRKLAEDFQRLCLHAGWSTIIKLKYKAGTKRLNKKTGKYIINTVDSWRMTINKHQNEPVVNKNKGEKHDEMIDYKGKVYCCQVDGGVLYVKRNNKTCWAGNSRHGQKGICGMVYADDDMPFTEDGMKPDIIVNPHAIPSRMTIAQLIECILSKTCALYGRFADGTPFNGVEIGEIAKDLENAGYNKFGYEQMYSGFTGEPIKAKIFIGPTYYQRLKHIVADKIHSRSRGPYQMLTRLPAEGRAMDGGHRFGEMERDGIISHGLAGFLKERFLDCADGFECYVDDESGLVCIANPYDKIFYGKSTENYTHISKIRIPYSMKQFIYECITTGIVPRLITEQYAI